MRFSRAEQEGIDPGEILELVHVRLYGGTGRTKISYRERKRRQALCFRLIKIEGSPAAASRRVGVSLAQWHYWQHGTRPVPDKWLNNLETAVKEGGKK